MEKLTKTITSIFMVPTLGVDRTVLQANDFLNGYAKDSTREENYEDACYLLFRPKNIDRFREFLDSEYERTKNIIEDYDHKRGFVVVVYKLDPNFKEDFDKIKQSKYSKTSPEFQALFPKTVKILVDGLRRDEISLQVRIFKKTTDLKEFWEGVFQTDLPEDTEFYDGYHEEREILTEEKLEQYLKKEEAMQ
jgi:hypothetical protein